MGSGMYRERSVSARSRVKRQGSGSVVPVGLVSEGNRRAVVNLLLLARFAGLPLGRRGRLVSEAEVEAFVNLADAGRRPDLVGSDPEGGADCEA